MKLNSLLFSFAVLFFKIIAGTKYQRLSAHSLTSANLNNPNTTLHPSVPMKSPAPQPPTLPKPNDGMVINKKPEASIEDVILSKINTNDKIEADIVNMIIKYALNYSTFKAIRFTTNEYLFEKKAIDMELAENERVLYNNFKVNSSYKDDHANSKFSTHILCNQEGNTTVEVVLPDIEITFNASVITSSDSSYHGSIWIILENGTLTGLVETDGSNMTSDHVQFAEISNEMSKFEVAIDSQYQISIYYHLQEILSQIKHSLEQFFQAQLNLQMQGIMNVTTGCSKGRLAPSNSNEIYVITDTKSDSWNDINLTVGPAIIEGLTNFNKVDFHIWDTSFENFNNILCANELSLRIIADSLTGKMRWNYSYPQNSSEMSTYAFNMDYFEIDCSMKPSTLASQSGLNLVKTEIDINLGRNRIVLSDLNRSEDERNFVNVILSDHLRMLINEWLQKSVTEKILPRIGYFDCFTGNPAENPF